MAGGAFRVQPRIASNSMLNLFHSGDTDKSHLLCKARNETEARWIQPLATRQQQRARGL